jgi:hypothetical protein
MLYFTWAQSLDLIFGELAEREIQVGKYSVFCDGMLDPIRMELRCALVIIGLERETRAELARALEQVVADRFDTVPRESWFMLGFVPLGTHVIRCDVLEQLSARLAATPPDARAREIQFALTCSAERAQSLARELFRSRRRRKRPRRT